jgi:tRNA threonylcarbamoyladenosine biosynthesis protein TsaE
MEIKFKLVDINQAANEFINNIGKNRCFAFHGDMGAGKTTFISAVCNQLGAIGNQSSPTFSIINEYNTSEKQPIYHLDLYRLKDEQEVIAAGVEDCLYSGNYCFIEWPDKAKALFNDNVVHCFITVIDNHTRNLKLIL